MSNELEEEEIRFESLATTAASSTTRKHHKSSLEIESSDTDDNFEDDDLFENEGYNKKPKRTTTQDHSDHSDKENDDNGFGIDNPIPKRNRNQYSRKRQYKNNRTNNNGYRTNSNGYPDDNGLSFITTQNADNPVDENGVAIETRYEFSHFIDHDKELSFVKMVAGITHRNFQSYIFVDNIEQHKESVRRLADGTIQPHQKIVKKYVYNEELLTAVVTSLTTVSNFLIKNYRLEDLRTLLINETKTAVGLARYVANFILTASNTLTPRNETRFNIVKQSHTHNVILESLIATMARTWPQIVKHNWWTNFSKQM